MPITQTQLEAVSRAFDGRVTPEIEHHTGTISFGYYGQFVVVGAANGTWGADIYASQRAYQDGVLPVADIETYLDEDASADEIAETIMDALCAS